ncbi:MAG: MMPL family transporter [Bacteroidales bacterium]|nr:MMPL family transporter [Bacteroidales bacterium]
MLRMRIYNYFKAHRKVLWISLTAVSLLLAGLASTLRFSEDITDFLPLDSEENEALEVYQNISGADRIICLFSNPGDADIVVEAIDEFVSLIEKKDIFGWCEGLVTGYDIDQVRGIMEFAYGNIPYFLQEKDYARMDSLLSLPGYIAGKMRQDRMALTFPSGDMGETVIASDPLGLFGPVIDALSGRGGTGAFELYDGYIFTPDMSRAIVMLTSPFGNSETSGNTKLVALIREVADEVEAAYPEVGISLTGGPVIAVGNSSRIKKDTVIAISISAILILVLLAMSFNSIRNILLIFLSIGWGWLFAVGGMAVFSSRVSIIVIGISSVILGIAVNYPLHLVAHTSHRKDTRDAVREIAAPLVIGNVTTVGAFLALVPLQSVALRDLGIFASLLLLGTIVFVLVCLPHMLEEGGGKKSPRSRLIPLLADLKPENNRWIVLTVIVLTVVFGFFSRRTSFNSNLADINYMTPEQRADLAYFNQLLSADTTRMKREFYVVSKGSGVDEVLDADTRVQVIVDSLDRAGIISSCSSVAPFLCSRVEQERRLEMWREFTGRFRSLYEEEFIRAAKDAGFNGTAFDRFESLLAEGYDAGSRDIEYFDILTEGPLANCLTSIDGEYYAVKTIKAEPGYADAVKTDIPGCFDIAELDNALATNLSSNFNYIGWACSLIVFFFLWFSFGRLELALIAFLPMAVSWIWILGLMALLGIRFNIVNIILATFIFGQGDDYTIFMAEGCQYEYARGKSVMSSYKSSIIQSALIMLVGIGTLIVAKHPAMKSLAEVTIIGMFSVVFMAYLIPPLLFKWLTERNGKIRVYPLTFRSLLFGIPKNPSDIVEGRYIYKGSGICREVRRNLSRASQVAETGEDGYVIEDVGYGETAILLAYTNPDRKVKALMKDDERLGIAVLAARDFVRNIEFVVKDE